MRTLAPLALFVSFLVPAAACGGRAAGTGAGGGPGTGDAGGDVTTSSSSGGSGSSSGGSGSSSGITTASSSSGGSSSGVTAGSSSGSSGGDSGTFVCPDGGSSSDGGGSGCAPLPGCCSDVACPGPGGCNTCSCQNGSWICEQPGCVLTSPGPDGGGGGTGAGGCPVADPVVSGDMFQCSTAGLSCTWMESSTCDRNCYCVSTTGMWKCGPCGTPPCPSTAPTNHSVCNPLDGVCDYPVIGGTCGTYECQCSPYGSWDCFQTDCIDGGVSPGGCTPTQPAQSSACTVEGLVCAYPGTCTTNCLCSNGAWDCAVQSPCQ